MTGHRDAMWLDAPFDEVRRHVAQRIEQVCIGVLHAQELCSEPGRRAAVLLAETGPTRGLNVASWIFEGLRYSALFVQVREADGRVEVVVAVTGAEGPLPVDFGRGRSIVSLFLAGLEI